jgi:hypothetical protein
VLTFEEKCVEVNLWLRTNLPPIMLSHLYFVTKSSEFCALSGE